VGFRILQRLWQAKTGILHGSQGLYTSLRLLTAGNSYGVAMKKFVCEMQLPHWKERQLVFVYALSLGDAEYAFDAFAKTEIRKHRDFNG
jgi:hypothetical protein